MKAIVFTLNGCSLAALGPYGNEWIATPCLDRLSTEAVTFDRHYSCQPCPTRARHVWLGGGLLQQLRQRGACTCLIQNNRASHDGPPEFYAEWAEQFDARPNPNDPSPATALLNLLPSVLNRLKSETSWLLWIDCDRLLPPWDAPQDLFDIYVEDLLDEEETVIHDHSDTDAEPSPPAARDSVPPWIDPPVGWFDRDDLGSWELLHRTYAAAVTAFDADFGKMMELFHHADVLKDAYLFFTADRGFPLGEHSMIGPHRPWLHEELVHLPLMIRPPGQQFSRRVPALTQPIDFTATLHGVYGSGLSDGLNLLAWLDRTGQPGRQFAVSRLAGESALRTEHWTLLKPATVESVAEDEPRGVQLYQALADRWEVNDLWRQHEAVLEELLPVLDSSVSAQVPEA